MKEHSAYDTGIDARWGDHLISLVTCEYTHRDGRLIVVAKKMEENGKGQGEKGDLSQAEKEEAGGK